MSGGNLLTVKGLTKALINPFYAITIHEGLYGEHDPLVSKDEWVGANMNVLKEVGPEAYLRTLLNVLEGDYPKGQTDEEEEDL